MESNQGSNSVLFALGELRDIEDDRVRDQRRREKELEAERKRLAKERAEMERQREEQRRFELELAERRASIEAQMKLEERRIALELERIPTPMLEAPARPRWPWVMSIAVVALAGLQFVMWQMQKELDQSLDELRIAQDGIKTTPVILDSEYAQPPPPPPMETVAAPDEPTKPEPTSRPVHHTKPKPPPPDKGVVCDDTKDPLGCLPNK